MVGHGGSSAGSYLTDPTSPIPSHCASIIATSTSRVNIFWPMLIREHLFKHCMLNILRMLRHMFVVYSTHIFKRKSDREVTTASVFYNNKPNPDLMQLCTSPDGKFAAYSLVCHIHSWNCVIYEQAKWSKVVVYYTVNRGHPPLSYTERPDYLPDCLISNTGRDYLSGGDWPSLSETVWTVAQSLANEWNVIISLCSSLFLHALPFSFIVSLSTKPYTVT